MLTAKNVMRPWIALGVAGVLALSACSAGADDSGWDMESSGSDSAPQEAPEAPAEADSDGGFEVGGEGELPSADLGESTGGDVGEDRSEENISAAGRSVITEGTVGMTVEDPWAVAQRITAAVGDVGGWVEDVTQRAGTETEGAYASLKVRIPSDEVGGTLEHLSSYGKVESVDVTRTDVTTQVRDLDARIRAMEMSVQRMAVFLDEATTRLELLEAEQMYTDRQAQLEVLLTQKAGISSQVSMSTLTIELWTPESAPEPEPEPEPAATGFWAGLTNGWNAFYDFGSDALLVIGALLPWLVFLALILVAVLAVRRPIQRWQRERVAARPARPVAPQPHYMQQYPQGPMAPPPAAPTGAPAPAGSPAAASAPRQAPAPATTGDQPKPQGKTPPPA